MSKPLSRSISSEWERDDEWWALHHSGWHLRAPRMRIKCLICTMISWDQRQVMKLPCALKEWDNIQKEISIQTKWKTHVHKSEYRIAPWRLETEKKSKAFKTYLDHYYQHWILLFSKPTVGSLFFFMNEYWIQKQIFPHSSLVKLGHHSLENIL